MSDLLRAEQKFREDRVNVVPIPGVSKRMIDRNKIRSGHPIPNIKDFVIELRPLDWLTSLFGLRKRLPSKTTMHTGMNSKANLYIEYMFNRIRTNVQKGEYNGASNAIGILMGSTAYQTASINYVMRNWHRKLEWKEVRILAKQVHNLVKRRATDINFARAYIPKGESGRPLGVPTPAGRVYLHMYNNCLVEGRNVTENGKQHGYLPGKGVITAGQDLSRMLKEPNIFEADFEGFFNNVTHAGLEHVMYGKLRLPFREVEFNIMLNQSLVKLQPKDKIEEKDRIYALLKDGSPNPQSRPAGFYRIDEQASRETLHMEYLPDRLYLEQSALIKKQGVPQGAPTSCSLATLALRHLDHLNVLFYADDVIYFPKSANCDPYMDLTKLVWGLKINRSKSRGVKKDGIGLVDSFKFLGIRYFPGVSEKVREDLWIGVTLSVCLDICIGYPVTTIFYLIMEFVVIQTETYERYQADTRNGATLAFTNRESFLSGLSVARQLMLDSEYFSKGTLTQSLTEWLQENFSKGGKLKSPAKLLFMKPFRHPKVQAELNKLDGDTELFDPKTRQERLEYVKETLKDYERMEERYPHIEKDLRNFIAKLMKPVSTTEVEEAAKKREELMRKPLVRNPLTGYFVSRMQSNSWDISVKQNFKLRYIAGSGVDMVGPSYSWNNIIPTSRITVFTASSFACHSLAEEIRAMKRGFPTVRYVSVPRHKGLTRHQLELLKILVMFRSNVG